MSPEKTKYGSICFQRMLMPGVFPPGWGEGGGVGTTEMTDTVNVGTSKTPSKWVKIVFINSWTSRRLKRPPLYSVANWLIPQILPYK